ncbi:MAG: DUF371 domain-containing protein [Methanoregulaceae archaeon]|jgi:hypothetical protein
MEATEIIRCYGHPLISATHPTTFEVTMDNVLTKKGNCIIGIYADKGAAGLSQKFKDVLCADDSLLTTTLICDNVSVKVQSNGSLAMKLNHPTDLVWRKSAFVCGRTIGIRSDKVARTLPTTLIDLLKMGRPLFVKMVVTRPD